MLFKYTPSGGTQKYFISCGRLAANMVFWALCLMKWEGMMDELKVTGQHYYAHVSIEKPIEFWSIDTSEKTPYCVLQYT